MPLNCQSKATQETCERRSIIAAVLNGRLYRAHKPIPVKFVSTTIQRMGSLGRLCWRMWHGRRRIIRYRSYKSTQQ